MDIIGMELNDAALTGAARGEILFAEPGYALAPDGGLLFGWPAWELARRYPRRVQRRFWRELSDEPMPEPVGAAHSAADLVHAQLAGLWRRCREAGREVIFAVPPYWDAGQLGLLLGIAQEEGLPVAGLVDSAVAASRRAYEDSEAVHLEASLQDTVVTRIAQDRGASLGERRVVGGVGIESLERVCIEHIAQRLVATQRFDPLHDGESEQLLYNRLYGWLEQLGREPQLRLDCEFRGRELAVDLERKALAGRIEAVLQPVIQQLRGLLPAGRALAVQVSHRLTLFPGLLDALAAVPDVAVFALEPGAAARGAVRAAGRGAASGRDGFRLLTSLPWDQPAVPCRAAGDAPAPAGATPTHVLSAARAYRLGPTPFEIGTELGPGDYGVAVPAGAAGVSRRHCSIRLDGSRVVLSDHSRFGTRLNGHMIDGSAVLQAGDLITVGTPPQEFRVIAEVCANGA